MSIKMTILTVLVSVTGLLVVVFVIVAAAFEARRGERFNLKNKYTSSPPQKTRLEGK